METYKPQSAQEIQDVVKQIFAPIFEAALQGEMDNMTFWHFIIPEG